MTKNQKKCFDFIVSYLSKEGVPPSYQEMMEHLGLHSKSGVHRLVYALIEEGHLVKLKNREGCARTLYPRSEVKKLLKNKHEKKLAQACEIFFELYRGQKQGRAVTDDQLLKVANYFASNETYNHQFDNWPRSWLRVVK